MNPNYHTMAADQAYRVGSRMGRFLSCGTEKLDLKALILTDPIELSVLLGDKGSVSQSDLIPSSNDLVMKIQELDSYKNNILPDTKHLSARESL